MSAEKTISRAPEPTWKWLYRVGGISALVLGLGYIIIIPLYVYTGAPSPSDAEAWLRHSSEKTTVWSAILGLSVLTDLLFVPAALSLYVALRRVNRNVMLLATAFVGLFVVLDLAVTWPNYASLISLGDDFAGATTDAQRAASVAAANDPSGVLTSGFFDFYAILVPSLGILMVGLVMLRGTTFSRRTAFVGVLTGISGMVAVVGPLFWSPLGAAAILTSVLTTVWVLFVGYRLFRLGS